MGVIMKNGISYGSGGGSGDSSIDLTQSEYDKLEASGKVNHDVTYYITDGVYEEGEGNTNIVKLTQVEYDALGDEKLSDNNIYLITDADELTAKNLAFDDTETGLGVNNIQDAIVEQNKNLNSTNVLTTLTKAEIDNNVVKPCNYSDYLLLLITYGHYSNIIASMVVDTEYFSKTSNTMRVLLTKDNTIIEIRKYDENSIITVGSNVPDNCNLSIMGVIKKG